MSPCGVCLCVSVCPSRSLVASKRTDIFEIFHHRLPNQAILVFPCQTRWQYSDGNLPHNRGVECRWGRQKTRFWTFFAAYGSIIQCCQLHESQSVKIKAATFVAGSTLYARDDGQPPPRTQPPWS